MIHPVSIIVTCYNQGRFASRAISSILNLHYNPKNLEIVVVDDGSTDDSVELIKPLVVQANEQIPTKLIIQENRGTAGARNTGIRNSKYDIFALLDIDDEYLPFKIKRSVEELTRYPNVGVVYTDYIEQFPDGKKRRAFKAPFNKHHLLNMCIVSTNSVFSREIFSKIGEFDERIKYSEDYDAYLRLSEISVLRHVPEPLFIYHHHGQNKMSPVDFTDMDNKITQDVCSEEVVFKQRILRGEYFVSNEH